MVDMRVIVAASGLIIAAASAAAEDYPALSVEIGAEVQLDRNYKVPAGARRNVDLFTNTELLVGLGFTEELSLQSKVKIEPLRTVSGDRFFGDTGAYVEELYVRYEAEPFGLRAGKMGAGFGSAWEKLPALYGKHELAEDYEITERIGLGASYKLDLGEAGTHELGVAAFFLDSTALSNSVFTRPDRGDSRASRPKRFRKNDPLSSNTRSLESFVANVKGEDIDPLPGLSYQLGYIFEKADAPALRDEQGFVVGLQQSFKIGDATITPFAEVAWFDNYQGESGDRTYLHLAAMGKWDSWLANAVFARRWIDRPAASRDTTDRLFSLTGGYDFGDGLTLLAGWKSAREEGETTRALGAMLTWAHKF